MDSAVLRLWYASFCVVPYLPQSLENVPLTSLLAVEDLEEVLVHLDNYPLVDDPDDLVDLDGEAS